MTLQPQDSVCCKISMWWRPTGPDQWCQLRVTIHQVSKNAADSLVRWYNMYESHQVTVHFAIFLMCKHLFLSFGKVGLRGSTVCDRVMSVPFFPPTRVQHSSSSPLSFQFVTCFQDLVVKVLRLVGIHIVSGSTDCLQEEKRIRREAAN